MQDYFIELLNISAIHIVCIIIFLGPVWGSMDFNTKLVGIYLLCLAAVMCAVLLITRQYITMDLSALRIMRLCFAIPVFILPFIIYREQIWKTVFIVAMALLSYSFISMITLFTVYKNPPENLLQSAGTTDILTGLFILTTVLFTVSRIYNNPDIEYAPVYWKIAFLIPALLSIAIVVFGYYTMRNGLDPGFILFAGAAFIASYPIIFLYEALTKRKQRRTESFNKRIIEREVDAL